MNKQTYTDPSGSGITAQYDASDPIAAEFIRNMRELAPHPTAPTAPAWLGKAIEERRFILLNIERRWITRDTKNLADLITGMPADMQVLRSVPSADGLTIQLLLVHPSFEPGALSVG